MNLQGWIYFPDMRYFKYILLESYKKVFKVTQWQYQLSRLCDILTFTIFFLPCAIYTRKDLINSPVQCNKLSVSSASQLKGKWMLYNTTLLLLFHLVKGQEVINTAYVQSETANSGAYSSE